MYWINLALTRMGFWITWALVPIVVEIIPAIMSTIKLMRLHRHMPRLKAPAKWPWVTIIVPVYNSEDTLFDCIRSIDHQTYDKKSMQIILANNQSTDDSFGAYARAQNAFPNLFLRYVNTDKGKLARLTRPFTRVLVVMSLILIVMVYWNPTRLKIWYYGSRTMSRLRP